MGPYRISLIFVERVIINWFVFVNLILQEIRLSNNTSDYEDPMRPSAILLRCTIMKFDSVLILLWLRDVSDSVIREHPDDITRIPVLTSAPQPMCSNL